MSNLVTDIHVARANALTAQTGNKHDPRFVSYLMTIGKISDYERGVVFGSQNKTEFLEGLHK